MARIVLGSYMIRYPLGGNLSCSLQYLIGLRNLGHEVYVFEKAGWENACYNPVNYSMTDDFRYGAGVLDSLLRRFGLIDAWCFVDRAGDYHGLSEKKASDILDTTDLFVDMGSHGAWEKEWDRCGLRVLIDGEPGFTQMKIVNRRAAGEHSPVYDRYFTTGRSVGSATSDVPTAGMDWSPIFHPVATESLVPAPSYADAPFTTVMKWQSHESLEYDGSVYGLKDVEFEKFVDLPRRTDAPLEQAVSGHVPKGRLEERGWSLIDAQDVSMTYDAYVAYIARSRGEFGVCKNAYVALKTGWFSDRSAVYLSLGKPVVLQETGWSSHLPCGEGLFAVSTVEEAAAAIDDIQSDYERHARRAREIAVDYLDSRLVLREFLDSVGL